LGLLSRVRIADIFENNSAPGPRLQINLVMLRLDWRENWPIS